jgi:hypothetical protein
MKKQVLNLGKALNKAEQKLIYGGWGPGCSGPQCYGPVPGCGTCEEYDMLPPSECKFMALLHIVCETGEPT